MAYHVIRKAALRMALCRALIKAVQVYKRKVAMSVAGGAKIDIIDIFDSAMSEATDATDAKKKEEEDKKKSYIPMTLAKVAVTSLQMKDKASAKAATPGTGLHRQGTGLLGVREGKSGWGAVGKNMRNRKLNMFLEKEDLRTPTVEESLKMLNDKVTSTQTALMTRVEQLETALHTHATSARVTNAKLDTHSELLERLVSLVSSGSSHRVRRTKQQHPSMTRKNTVGGSLNSSSGGGGGATSAPQDEAHPPAQGGAQPDQHAVLNAACRNQEIERRELREAHQQDGGDAHTRSSPARAKEERDYLLSFTSSAATRSSNSSGRGHDADAESFEA